MTVTTLQKRILLFLIGCIGIRLIFVIIAKKLSKNLQLAALPALLVAIGFMYIWLFDARKSGPEVFGDRIWWNSLRPFHASMYAIFAIMAYTNNEWAWVPLLIDVIIGLSAFSWFHKKN
jgi:hypothetical protein